MSTTAEPPFSFAIEPRPYDDPDIVRLVADVQREYVVRYSGEDEAPVDLSEFVPPSGRFFLGLIDGTPSVTGGWRRIRNGPLPTVEIKRMYVVPAARGRGLSRRMLAELERSAAADGAARVVLNTGDRQPEAVALYESSGYRTIPGFGHYADTAGSIFYGKRLDQPAGP